VSLKLSFKQIVRTVLALYAANWRVVVPFSVFAAFVPFAVEELIAHDLPNVWASILTSGIDTLATVFFAGAAEELEHRWEEGKRRVPVKDVLRSLPPVIWPLTVVALITTVAYVIGLLLLLIPGLIILTLWAVAGPVVVAERTGILKAFSRSRQLVRGNAWRVFVVLLVAEVLAAVVGTLVSLVFTLWGDRPDEPVALAIGEALTLPLEGLAVPVMYWRLREIEDARAETAAAEEAAAGA
jgi:hypothetical protein